jgi:signal peptidase II
VRDVQAAPGTPLSPRRRRRIAVLAAVAVFVLAADIISKAIVVAHLRPEEPVHLLGNVFEFWLTRNPGAAFSVGTGETAIFTLIAFGVVIYIARTARKLYSLAWAIALGLLLGGAAGNLGDRIFRAPGLFRGNVIDWIGVVPRYYPIFNLADSAIVCGGILMVILAMRGYHMDGTRSVDEPRTDKPDADEPGVDEPRAAEQRDVPAGSEAEAEAAAHEAPAGTDAQATPGTETVRPAEQ